MKTFRIVVLVLLVGLSLYQMVLPIVRAPFKMEIDPDDGWNAFFSEKAMTGLPLYRHPTPWLTANYPPFSFYAVGALGRLIGDTLLAGRALSILSLVGVCLMISLVVARRTRDAYASIFAGFFCLGSFAAFGTYYVGKNDPEMLGHLGSVAALAVYMLDGSILEKPKKLFLVAFLCLTGLLFKPSVLAVPLAIGLDILIRSWRKFFIWAGAWSLAAAGLALIGLLLWGPGLFVQVLTFPRGYSLAKLGADALVFGAVNAIPLAVLYPWLRRRATDDPVRVAALFLGLATVIGLVFSGGYGTDVNSYFSFLVALPLVAGLFLSEIKRSGAGRPHAALAPFAVAAGFLIISILKIPAMPSRTEVRFGVWRPGVLQALRREERETLADAAYVRTFKGPIVCESILLPVLARKEFIFDPFFVRGAIEKGKLSESDLVKRIENGEFALIQLEAEIGPVSKALGPLDFVRNEAWYDRWTGNLKHAIAARYRIDRRSSNGVFYVPSPI